MSGGAFTRRAAPLAVSAIAAWISCGAVSPLDATGSGRAAILPPVWVLGALLAAAALVALAPRTQRVDTSPLYLSAAAFLPWIPAPWPPALLLWQGPMLAALWAAVAIALTWPLWARVGRAIIAQAPGRQAMLAAAIAAACYAAAAWRMAPTLPAGDEPHYLIITQSLLSDGDLQIENNHRRHDSLAYTTEVLKPDYLRRGRNNAIYSIHAPGLPTIVAPAFMLGGYPAVVLFLACVAAFGTWLVWRAAHLVTGEATAAWAGWATVSLTVPYFFLSFTVYPDGLGAVLVMTGVYALVRPERLVRWRAAVHGTAIAVLPWLHTRFAVVAAVLALLLILRAAVSSRVGRVRLVLWLLAPVLVSAAGWFWFFYAIYGTPNPAAPYGGYTQSSIWNAPRGLTGLLLDQQFGILPHAPVFLAAFAGLAWLFRGRARLALEILLVVVPYAAASASYHMWWGGRSSPARFAGAVLLPLGMAAAVAWTKLRSPGRAAFAALLVTSVGLTAAMAGVDHGALVYNTRDGFALWAEAASPLVRLPLALPSLFRGDVAAAWSVAAGWFIAAALGTWLARALAGWGAWDAGTMQRTVVLVAAYLIVTLGCSLSWAAVRAQPIDAGTGLWRLVSGVSRGAARLAFIEFPYRLMEPTAMIRQLRIPTTLRGSRPGDGAFYRAEDVPPGEYFLQAASGLRIDGALRVTIGRSPAPLVDVVLRDAPPERLPLSLSFPVGAEAVLVAADRVVQRSAATLVARVGDVHRKPRGWPATRARGAVRNGEVVAWFLDEGSWKEPSGFWVAGRQTARVVLASDRPAAVALQLRNGAVPNRVSVAVRTRLPGRAVETELTMAPGERHVIPIPAIGPGRPLLVTCSSENGFRPADVDPGSLDYRLLGVRIDLPAVQNLTTPPK